MNTETKHYSSANDNIRVSFDGEKCAHAGYCFQELPAVFDSDNDPPINLSAGSLEDIIRVVEKCPSSALVYKRLDGGAEETAPDKATATLERDGPLALRGKLELDGQEYTRLTLCRCGHSQNKPFCDGSHSQHAFDDQAEVSPEDVPVSPPASKITLTPYPDGPVGFNGDITVHTADGSTLCQRNKGAFCRCGASKNKPFCDGSHKTANFKA